MESQINKTRPPYYRAVAITIMLVYIGVVLRGIALLPPFTDELTHLDWATRDVGGGWQFGKGLSIPLLAVFSWLSADPLIWGRYAAALVSVLILSVMMKSAESLFDYDTSLMSGLLYLVVPYNQFYSRLAFIDPFMVLFLVVAMLFAFLVMRQPALWRWAVLCGALIFAILSKLLAVVFLALPLLGYVFFCREARIRRFRDVVIATGIVLVVVLLAMVAGYGRTQFSWTGAEPDALTYEQIQMLFGRYCEWGAELLTMPILWLVLVAVGYSLIVREVRALYLIAQGVLMLCSLWFLSFVAPRYLMYVVVLVIVLDAWLLVRILRGIIQKSATLVRSKAPGYAVSALLMIGLLSPAVLLDVDLIRDPINAALPDIVRWQYIEGWPSGYGMRETTDFLVETADTTPGGINLLNWNGPFGTYYSLYPPASPNLHLLPYDIEGEAMQAALSQRRTLKVFTCIGVDAQALATEGYTLIWSYAKPGGGCQYTVWEYQAALG